MRESITKIREIPDMRHCTSFHPCGNTPILEVTCFPGRLRVAHKASEDRERVIVISMTVHVIDDMEVESRDVRCDRDITTGHDPEKVIITGGWAVVPSSHYSNEFFVASS